MARISEQASGGRNVLAFLDMLAYSEGTDNGRQPTKDEGYDVLVGGQLFSDYSKHPNKLVHLNASLSSTAAGRYQILARFWRVYQQRLHLPDFGPVSQDLYAINQLKEQGAYGRIQAGEFEKAVLRVKNIWASLPGAGYNQHEQSMDVLRDVYLKAGGTIAGA